MSNSARDRPDRRVLKGDGGDGSHASPASEADSDSRELSGTAPLLANIRSAASTNSLCVDRGLVVDDHACGGGEWGGTLTIRGAGVVRLACVPPLDFRQL
jgi:hypothetical protein